MHKKFILFDLDGTLTDPKEGITKSVEYALNDFGIRVDSLDELTRFIGPPLKDSFMKYYEFSDAEAERAITKYREYYSTQGIFENALYDGIAELLQQLKAKDKTLIVATSKPTVFAEKVLKHFEIDGYFSYVAGSELDGSRTIKSQVIQYALDHVSISSLDHAIMVGDRKYDILGAQEIGMDSIGVLYGYGSHDELTAAKATFLVETVGALSELLNTL